MPYITFVSIFLLAAGGIFSLYGHLQTLQQNSYRLLQYFKFITAERTLELALSAVLYCFFTLLVLKGRMWLCLAVAILLLAVRIFLNIKTNKKSDKKLVFTVRIKTLYIAAILILGISLFGCLYSSYTILGEISRVVCIALSIVTPILMAVIWVVTYPIEKIIKK